MTKDSNATVNLPEESQVNTSATDLFHTYLNAPATKLDADEYSAADIDGVTEGLSGSGNLNFLLVQTSQVDAANITIGEYFYNPASMTSAGSLFQTSGHAPLQQGSITSFYNPAAATTDKLQVPENLPGGMLAATGNISSSSLMIGRNLQNSITDNDYNVNTGNISGAYTRAENAATTANENTTTQTTTTNNSYSETTNVTNITNSTEIVNLEECTNILETIENIYNSTTNVTTNITNNVTDITENIINTVNNTTDILTTTINSVTNITESILNGCIAPNLGPIGLDLDATISSLTSLNLDIIGLGSVTNVLNETIDLSGILTPINPLTGDILSGISLLALLNPLHPDETQNDTDIHAELDLSPLNIPVPELFLDIPLDPIESLIGDIDVSLDLTQHLLNTLPIGSDGGADTDIALGLEAPETLSPILEPAIDAVNDIAPTVFNPVEDLIGDIDIGFDLGTNILGIGSGSAQDEDDTDISITGDLDLANHDLLNLPIHINIDPVESLIGDVDLDLGVAGDILGQAADAVIDDFNGGSGSDTLLSGIGNVTSDIVSDIIDTMSGITDVPEITSGIDISPLSLDTGNGDTDLTIDIPLIDPVEMNLDLIETFTGDIDMDISLQNLAEGAMSLLQGEVDDAIGLLTYTNSPGTGLSLLDNIVSSAGTPVDSVNPISGWTQTILPGAGELPVSGLTADILGDMNTALPDPVIATPILPVPIGSGGHGGGLFGGGGIFG